MLYHEIIWRGTQRRFEVIFANVRELPDESLSTHADERKVVVDFPFDEPGNTPADDLARLNDFRRRDARARTLVWLPSFLSPSAKRDLGTLVKIDHVLAGERLRDFATHLSPADRCPRASSCGISRASSDAPAPLPGGCLRRGKSDSRLARRVARRRPLPVREITDNGLFLGDRRLHLRLRGQSKAAATGATP